MARKVEWTRFAVAAIRELENQPDRLYVDRKTVQKLLYVSASHALNLMGAVGTDAAGNSHVVRREALVRFLETAAADQVAAARAQSKRFAATLGRLERERREQPPLLVTTVPRQLALEVARRGLDDLPEGIHFVPGEITISFQGAVDALHKLKLLCIAIAADEERFVVRAECAGEVVPVQGRTA